MAAKRMDWIHKEEHFKIMKTGSWWARRP